MHQYVQMTGFFCIILEKNYLPKSSASFSAKASPLRFSPTMTPFVSIKYMVGIIFTL